MAIKNIQLNTLLNLFYAKESAVRSKARDDVKKTLDKEQGVESDGGMDFHNSFWSDVKDFMNGRIDLTLQTAQRADLNRNRKRLYPLLAQKFLEWWNEKKRWSNEGCVVATAPKGRYNHSELGVVVRINNILALDIGSQPTRYFYPYFSEKPALDEEAARIGLWLMQEALDVPPQQLRLLDVLRAKSYSLKKHPLQGNEEALFKAKYGKILDKWDELYAELA